MKNWTLEDEKALEDWIVNMENIGNCENGRLDGSDGEGRKWKD